MHHQKEIHLKFPSGKCYLLLHLFSKQQTTVHGSILSYAVHIHCGGNLVSLTCSVEAHNLHVCLNPLLSNDTSSLKIVSHLPGRPGYVISFIQDMRHKQDMHLTEVKDSRFKLQLPKCTQREKI